MKIKKQLKYGSFQWDDETKKFTVSQGDKSIELSKVYAFAFLRFVFRIAQRNWFRKPSASKVTIKKLDAVASLEDDKLDNSSTVSSDKVLLVQKEEGMEIEQYDLL